MFLCKDCEIFRFPYMAPLKSSATVPSTTTSSGGTSVSTCIVDEQAFIKSSFVAPEGKCDDCSEQTAGQHCYYQPTDQLEACGGAVTCEESVVETKLPLQTQVTLITCELLFFVQGTFGRFGQYPELSIKTNVAEFYREDEIFSAKR